MCIRIYIFLIEKNNKRNKNQKRIKEDKRVSLEKLRGYDDIAYKFSVYF